MRLRDLIFEINLTVDQALDILGLSRDELGTDIVKKKFRKKSLEVHPDRGGTKDQQQRVNAAYELLKNKSRDSRFGFEEMGKRYRERAEQINKVLKKSFKLNNFKQYFKRVYGQEFFYKIRREFPNTEEKNPSYAGFVGLFYNKDKSIMFEFGVTVYLPGLVTKSLGGKNISFTVMVEAYGFYDNRKIKMYRRDWKFTQDHSFLEKPDLVFPESKLKKNVSQKKFSKKDMLTYLKIKLGARIDREYVWIPLSKTDKDLKLLIYRSVFMKTPSWGINGLYKIRRIDPLISLFLPENIDTVKYFEKIQSGSMKKSSVDDVGRYLNSILRKKKTEYMNKLKKK